MALVKYIVILTLTTIFTIMDYLLVHLILWHKIMVKINHNSNIDNNNQ